MRFPSKWVWLAATTLSAGMLVSTGNFTQAWQNPRQPRTVERVDDLEAEDLPVKRGPGWVELPKCHVKLIDSVILACDRPGVIAFIEPEEGDSVRAQQQIAGMKDELAVALLEVAKIKAENDVHIRFAKVSADVSKKEYEKNVLANKKLDGTIPEVEVQRSLLAWQKAILQGEQAEHEMKISALERAKSEEELKTFKVEAPFDGKVRRILKRKGEAVRQGDPILELVSTRRVKVEGLLPLDDYWNVKPGDTVSVQIDIPDRELEIENEVFEGKIIFVEPTVSPVTHGARVWAEVQNKGERLIEGLYARMKIKHSQRGAAAKPVNSGIKQAGGNR